MDFNIIPEAFPDKGTETTVIALRKTTLKVDVNKIRRLDDRNFAVLSKSSGISFHVGVVSLTAGKGCGEIRKQEAREFVKLLGKTYSPIIGGLFNEDLTA